MAYGLTPTGFTIKRLPDIITEQKAKAVEIFQDLVEPGDVVDTSDSSTLGRLINLDSVGDSELWEQAQLIYSAMDPNTATGIPLDNIVAYSGITRQSESSSTVVGLFSGSYNTTIPLSSYVSDPVSKNKFLTTGSIVLNSFNASGITVEFTDSPVTATTYSISYTGVGSSDNLITYTCTAFASSPAVLTGLRDNILSAHNAHLTAEFVAGSPDKLVIKRIDPFSTSTFTLMERVSGDDDTGITGLLITKVDKIGNLQADKTGPIEQEPNTLTTIDTPALGWDSVTNPLAASVGSYRQSDEELRVEFRNTKFIRSSNILDSLYSALVALDTVTDVKVYENDTDSPIALSGSYNLAPHSFLSVVNGGTVQDIANTIWRNKPLGIGAVGNTFGIIIDSQGFSRNIYFTIPSATPIYISLDITVDDSNTFPADGDAQIKEAIIQYALANLNVGDDVYTSRLYTPVNSVLGHVVNHIYISTSPSPGSYVGSIPIEFDAVASFSSVNITITHTL